MIVNPVRYGSGETKTVEVTIDIRNSSNGSYVYYITPDGAYVKATITQTGPQAFQMRAGDLFLIYGYAKGLYTPVLTNAIVKELINNGTPYMRTYQVNA